MKRLIQRCGAILVILALISGVLSSCGTEEVSSVEFNEETNTTHPATSETSLQWEVTTHTVTCAEHEQNIAITRVGDDYHLLCASLPNYGAMKPLDEAFALKASDSLQHHGASGRRKRHGAGGRKCHLELCMGARLCLGWGEH